MKLDTLLREKLRVLLVGPPGCGKTARIRAAATGAGYELVVMRASLMERVDIGGCMVPDQAAGVTRALPLETLHRLRATDKPTLLVYDDLGQAPIDTQASFMRTFDAGFLSPHVLIWGATNRPGDKAGVTALCEPLRSRFDLAFAVATPDTRDAADGPVMLGDWKSEVEGWCEWQLSAYPKAPEIAAWHRSPHLGAQHAVGPVLYGWKPHADPAVRMPDFRSWEVVCRLWAAGVRDLPSVAAAIGKGQTAAFLAYAATADKLPTPEEVWAGPDKARVPEEPSALCLVVTRLASALEKKHVSPFVAYIERLPILFGALASRDAYRRMSAEVTGNKDWQRWFVKHQDLFDK